MQNRNSEFPLRKVDIMKFLSKHRRFVAVFLCLFLTLLSISTVTYLRFRFAVRQVDTRLDHALKSTSTFYREHKEGTDIIADYEKSANLLYIDIYSRMLENREINVETLNYCHSLFPTRSFYFISHNGASISDSQAPPLKAIYNVLKEDPTLTYYIIDNEIYTCRHLEDGWFIMNEPVPYDRIIWEPLDIPSPSENVLCWNTSNGKLLLNSVDAIQDLSPEEFLTTHPNSYVPNEFFGIHIGYNEEMGYFPYKEIHPRDHILVVAYADPGIIIRDVFRDLSVVLIFIPLIAYTMCMYAIRIYDKEDLQSTANKRVFFRHYVLNLEYFYHLSALLIISIVIASLTTAYIHLLTNFSEQNMRAASSLECLDTMLESDSTISTNIDAYITSAQATLSSQLAIAYENVPDMMKPDGLERICNNSGSLEISEISVIDKNGIIISSNLYNIDYELNPNLFSDADALEFLNNNNDDFASNTYRAYDLTHLYKRLSDSFILRITVGQNIDQLLTNYSFFSNSIDSCDFGEAEKYYLNVNSPENLYTVTEKKELICLQNDWEGIASVSVPYQGIHRLNGHIYYINTLLHDDLLLIRALPIRYILLSFLQSIFVEVFSFILIYGVLVLLTACYYDNAMTSDVNHHIRMHHIPEKLRDGTFHKSIRSIVNIALILLIVIFLLDGFISKNALTRYLLSNEWEDGLNLFSFTKILIAFITVRIFNSLIQKIVMIIAKGTSNRGITIGHLVCSMVKFGSLVFIVVYSLVQIGVKLNSLLTGAGLAGAALAFAGQSVINDLLSGFFIVFEGKFGVGDWVTIDNFRGQITEIGVRTTSVSMADDIKIFHNSALSGITVWSHGMSGAICTVDVAYREDLERVLRILQSSSDRYMREIPEMEEPPYIHGVIQLGSSGVTLRMTSYLTNQQNVGRVQRAMLLLTKRIFDENDVCIPFPQVVVHEGEKDIIPVDAAIFAIPDVKTEEIITEKNGEKTE